METLDKIIEYYIKHNYKIQDNSPRFKIQGTPLSSDEIKKSVMLKIKEIIIDEVVFEKKKELDLYAKNKIAAEKNKAYIDSIKQLLWEGFILAIFVGLLGNELTTLIDCFKRLASEEWYLIITVILIVVFLIIVLIFYIIKFTKDIIKHFKENEKGNINEK